MIMPKNFSRLMKSQASGGRSRHSQLIFQSSSMAQSSSTGPLRNASSSVVRVAGALASSFDQSGLPVNRSASHQTSPASSASRSVSDMVGSTVRAQAKIGLVRVSRRRADAFMGRPPCRRRVGPDHYGRHFRHDNGSITQRFRTSTYQKSIYISM